MNSVVAHATPAPIKVLLTSFEAFGGENDNASLEMVNSFRKQLAAGAPGLLSRAITLKIVVLPVVYGGDAEHPGAEDLLKAAIESFQPEVVISFGQIVGETNFRLETEAFNLDDEPLPDNAGVVHTQVAIVPGGDDMLKTTLPAFTAVQAVHAAHLPARLSQSAGRYLCNHVFYSLLNLQKFHPTIRAAGFVHVPGLPAAGPHTPAAYQAQGDWGAPAVAAILNSVLKEL